MGTLFANAGKLCVAGSLSLSFPSAVPAVDQKDIWYKFGRYLYLRFLLCGDIGELLRLLPAFSQMS